MQRISLTQNLLYFIWGLDPLLLPKMLHPRLKEVEFVLWFKKLHHLTVVTCVCVKTSDTSEIYLKFR